MEKKNWAQTLCVRHAERKARRSEGGSSDVRAQAERQCKAALELGPKAGGCGRAGLG